jgi:xanthine dehydrogenase accessory factor
MATHPDVTGAARLLGAGGRLARGVLVRVDGSAPFDAGDVLFADPAGTVAGDVTRGAVDAEVAGAARAVMAGEAAPGVLDLLVTDELAAACGLRCGGRVGVLVSEVGAAARAVEARALEAVAAERPHAVARRLDGAGAGLYVDADEVAGTLGDPALDAAAAVAARELLEAARSRTIDLGTEERPLPVMIAVRAPAPRMVVLGAIDYAFELADLASRLGWEVTIADPRRPFSPTDRFSAVATTSTAAPGDALAGLGLGPRDAVLVFTHDLELDAAGVHAALAQDTGYIGALGSRRTTARRRDRLVADGVAPEQLARLHAPCGLDVGARTPGEAAVSIMAEILATRATRGGGALRDSAAPILPADR